MISTAPASAFDDGKVIRLRFDDFSTSIRLGLKRTPIRAIIIKKSGNDHIKYQMFKRLNTGGSLLAPQEIRNCSCRMISGGAEFYTEIQGLANYQVFKDATARIPQTDREQRADEELVLRFFAVEGYRNRFAGNVREWLDDFMEETLFQKIAPPIETQRFVAFFTFIADKFGDGAFSRWRDNAAQGRLAPAYFEAVVGALSQRFGELEGKKSEDLQKILAEAFEDAEFKEATGPGANSKSKMEKRIAVVSKYFFPE
jgi:hypothetical protein